MTIKQKMEEMLKRQQSSTIRNMSNTALSMMYYSFYHFNISEMTVAQYSKLVHAQKIPTMESVTRALRKCREERPEWKRPKQKVENAKEYIRNESRS